jgi:hypothetical protein
LSISRFDELVPFFGTGGSTRRCLLNLAYLLLQSAVTRRRSSMEAAEEEGKTPRFIRHCNPLRSPNLLFSGSDLRETESELKIGDNNGSTTARCMTLKKFHDNPDAQTQRNSRKN